MHCTTPSCLAKENILLAGKESNPSWEEVAAAHPKVGLWLVIRDVMCGWAHRTIPVCAQLWAEEEEEEPWRKIEARLTGGPTSVYQSCEPPCGMCSRQNQCRNGKNMCFSLDFQILLNFQRSLWSLLWDWIIYVTQWAFLDATLSKIGTEQCWINLQTCLPANPQCSCCSSLVAH